MLNPTAWNWGNYTGFFWVGKKCPPQNRLSLLLTNVPLAQAGICFLCIIYTYFRVPEPRGRSFAELDLLFERGVSARKFATTSVDVFDATVRGSLVNQYEAGHVLPSDYEAKGDITHSEKIVQ